MGSMESIIKTLMVVVLEIAPAYNLFHNNLILFSKNINDWVPNVNF
jgi:hypothetical protein